MESPARVTGRRCPISLTSNETANPQRRRGELSDRLKSSSRPVEEQLVYQDSVEILLPAYQWVDIKLFKLPKEPIDDRKALGLLLRHVRYRDSYASENEEDAVNIHGPYCLEAITTDAFERSDGASAEATIRTWAEQVVPVPDIQRNELQRELYPRVHTATSCYRLAVGSEAQHESGWVVGGMTGFHEFVLIDHRAGTLALVVASDD
jgi:hypothetical protein